MINAIIYILAFLVFLVTILLFKKDDKKRNLILWIIIMTYVGFVVNSLIVFVLGIFNLAAPMLLRSLVFLGLSSYPLYTIIKKKEIQKYEISYIDYIVLVVAIGLTIGIGIWRFGNFNLVFETSDPAMHYGSAEKFAQSSKLLDKVDSKIIVGGTNMYFTYTITGTGFQIVDAFGGTLQQKLACFYCIELLVILSSFLLVFYSINSIIDKKNWKRILLSIIICILYILGYPLNNLMFGFHYLGIGILLGILLLKLISETLDKDTNKIYLALISMIAFSIFTCYYLFMENGEEI